MRVKVIEPFSTAKGNIPIGAIIDMPEKMLESLRGKVEPILFNYLNLQTEINNLSNEVSSKDPGGDCWQWMKDNSPELWESHLAADMALDTAFQEQSTEKIDAAISRTRETFSAMIDAWNNRQVGRGL